MKKAALHNLGCKVNAYETEAMQQLLEENGYVQVGKIGSLELTEKGNIKVNENMETTIPGLYAAGDCTGGLLQVAKAVYEGAQAGIHAGKYVRSLK